jgi:hypothetical protein
MRKANIPKDGYIFRHKTNTDAFSRELYLAEGESLSDWEEVTEAEYEAIQKEAEEKARASMGMIGEGLERIGE